MAISGAGSATGAGTVKLAIGAGTTGTGSASSAGAAVVSISFLVPGAGGASAAGAVSVLTGFGTVVYISGVGAIASAGSVSIYTGSTSQAFVDPDYLLIAPYVTTGLVAPPAVCAYAAPSFITALKAA